MSTTVPAPTAAPSGAGPTSDQRPDARPVRLLGPVAVASGAVLAAAGLALHLEAMPEDERLTQAMAEDPQWVSSHLLIGLGFAVVAIGVVHVIGLVRGRGAALTAGGAVLTAAGAVLMSLSNIAHGAVALALRDQVDASASLDIHLAYFEHPATLALNAGPMLLTLGMITLGAGLLRARTAPRWAGAAVLLTPIAVNASFALSLPPYLQALPFLLGLLALAHVMHRR